MICLSTNVDALQQTRSEFSVHRNATSNRPFNDQLEIFGQRALNTQHALSPSSVLLRAFAPSWRCSFPNWSSSCRRAFVVTFFPELVFFVPSCLRGDVLSRISLLRAFVP